MEENQDHPLETPIEFLASLDDSERRVFFAFFEYVVNNLLCGGGLPQQQQFDQLTRKTRVTSYILRFAQSYDLKTMRDALGTIQSLMPFYMSVPPGHASSHSLSSMSVDRHADKPLNGMPLLDKQSKSWEARLQDVDASYHKGAGPLIFSYFEARQMRAEYGSLHFKKVDGTEADEFPCFVQEQRALIAILYDAIKNTKGILEMKKPLSIKKSASSKKKSEPEDGTDPQSQDGSQDEMEGRVPKSVSKVKKLSRIEVEMLCWEVLMAIRDIHAGRLPFADWSSKDWAWDPSFVGFRARFDAVAATLRQSKAAVCSLLESDYLERLVAHPRREYQRKANNRTQNAERNAQVKVGRHAIKERHVVVTAAGDLQDRDGNVVVPAQEDSRGIIEQTWKLSQRERKRARALADHGDGDGDGDGDDDDDDGNDGESGRRRRRPKVARTKTQARTSRAKAPDDTERETETPTHQSILHGGLWISQGTESPSQPLPTVFRSSLDATAVSYAGAPLRVMVAPSGDPSTVDPDPLLLPGVKTEPELMELMKPRRHAHDGSLSFSHQPLSMAGGNLVFGGDSSVFDASMASVVASAAAVAVSSAMADPASFVQGSAPLMGLPPPPPLSSMSA